MTSGIVHVSFRAFNLADPERIWNSYKYPIYLQDSTIEATPQRRLFHDRSRSIGTRPLARLLRRRYLRNGVQITDAPTRVTS
jgi:hypothetical protein